MSTSRVAASRTGDGGRAALYVRVSTEDQAKEGFSLAAQEKRLRALCRVQEWEVVDVYMDDGFSGRDIRRPAYQRMMAERDRWDKLVVLKMDRLHRNSRQVRRIVAWRRSRRPYRWIADFLNAERVPTKTGKGRWTARQVYRIAKSAWPYGLRRWEDLVMPGDHRPILPGGIEGWKRAVRKKRRGRRRPQ